MSLDNILKKAVDIINSGGVIACPTESVYGLSCDPSNLKAILKLAKLKKRALNKGFILTAGDLTYFKDYIEPLNINNQNIINNSVLNISDIKNKNNIQATSWLVPASNKILPELIGDSHNLQTPKIAIRVSSHPVISSLTKLLKKPIISTSANISGYSPCESYQDVYNIFKDDLDFIIKSDCWGLPPSVIKDLHSKKIIRI